MKRPCANSRTPSPTAGARPTCCARPVSTRRRNRNSARCSTATTTTQPSREHSSTRARHLPGSPHGTHPPAASPAQGFRRHPGDRLFPGRFGHPCRSRAAGFRRAGRHRAVAGRAARRRSRHSPAGDWRVPGSHVGDAAADVGRSRGQCVADPPLHRRASQLHLDCVADGLPGRRARLRFRRCDVHACRRARDLRGIAGQLRSTTTLR